MKKKNIFSC